MILTGPPTPMSVVCIFIRHYKPLGYVNTGTLRPSGGTGRHAGLKILWIVISVRVQLPSWVPTLT